MTDDRTDPELLAQAGSDPEAFRVLSVLAVAHLS